MIKTFIKVFRRKKIAKIIFLAILLLLLLRFYCYYKVIEEFEVDSVNDINLIINHRTQFLKNKFSKSLPSIQIPIKKYEETYRDLKKPKKELYPGKNGEAVVIDDSLLSKSLQLHKFNEIASDMIPIEREIPDRRWEKCLLAQYSNKLVPVSIIIIFHNEAFSTLMRTIYSVFSRSPPYLVGEIILVDDGSDLNKIPDIGKKLENSLEKFEKIKLIRHPKSYGLVSARLTGAKIAKETILVFLDSHCECSKGWLEPLIDWVISHPNSAITPVIDTINHKDFSIHQKPIGLVNIGIFDWKLDFNWKLAPGTNYIDPIDSPTMAGGLFAINKTYFFNIGSYDEEFKQWGSENLELSFRIWMCGGTVKVHPCSIVAHVFRDVTPHDLKKENILMNKLRLIHTWLDEYKDIVFRQFPSFKTILPGNLSSRIQLRKNLKCKTFDWYIKNILKPSFLPAIFPLAHGKLKSNEKCIDSSNKPATTKQIKLQPCSSSITQNVEMTMEGSIYNGENCIDLEAPTEHPKWYTCHGLGGNQKWIHSTPNSIIKHFYHNMCLASQDSQIIIKKCNHMDESQKFSFSNYSSKKFIAN